MFNTHVGWTAKESCNKITTNMVTKNNQQVCNNSHSHHQGIMDSNYSDISLKRTQKVELIKRQPGSRNRDRRKKEYWKNISTSCVLNVFIFVLSFVFLGHSATGFVIAPPWANPEVNICSKKSWQLIYWPKDDKCYQIFEQGPCPRSQVISLFDLTWFYEFFLRYIITKITFPQGMTIMFVVI